MARHRPPSSNTKSRSYFNALSWQMQRYLLNLPDNQLEPIVRSLTPDEIDLFCDRMNDELRGVIARYLDDELVLRMADEQDRDFTPQRLATLKQIREKILSFGFGPPAGWNVMELRNKRCGKKLEERLKRLGHADPREQQVEQKDRNEELADRLLEMLPLLSDSMIQALLGQLDDYQRVLLTRWADDGVKGIVYRLLPKQEVVELETYPVGPIRESALYAELAGFYEMLQRLDPKPATGKKREQLLKRKERLAAKVQRERERRKGKSESERFPLASDLEQLTRQQLSDKLATVTLLCRKHGVRDEEYRERLDLNPWLAAAIKKEKNHLTRWALQAIQGTADPESPPKDAKQAVRERKLALLTEFSKESFSGNQHKLTWSEVQALLGNEFDDEPADHRYPSIDACPYRQFLEKLRHWEQICTDEGPEEVAGLIDKEQSPLLRCILEIIVDGRKLRDCLPMLLLSFHNQQQDKRELLIAFARRNSGKGLENPHAMEELHDLALDMHQKIWFRRTPGIAQLNSCRYAPLRHLRMQGGLDSLSRLQVCCKVLSFLYHYRKHGAASLQPLVATASPFFKSCFQATIEYIEEGFGKYSLADRLEQIADEQCALLEANFRAAIALFPWIGPWYDPQRYAAERARYGNPEPAALPDNRYSLEQFTPMELAARIEAYNRICSGSLPYLMLDIAPLDLNLPPDTPTDQEQVPLLHYLVTNLVDGANPKELELSLQAVLPIIMRQFREKARYVTWGLCTFLEQGSGLVEVVYRYCLEDRS